jgi:DNA-nicking Smr family endonuclease
MSSDHDLLGATIYQRTQKGQIVCASRASSSNAQFMMLLRLFNGLTPTQIFLELSGMPASEAQSLVTRMEELKLIELAQ